MLKCVWCIKKMKATKMDGHMALDIRPMYNCVFVMEHNWSIFLSLWLDTMTLQRLFKYEN